MAKDNDRINEFLNANLMRSKLARVLRGAGFDISFVSEAQGQRRWAIWAKPDVNLQKILGSPKEILVIGTEVKDLQHRTLDGVEATISSEKRLSEELCVVVGADPDTETKVRELTSGSRTVFIGISYQHLDRFHPLGEGQLVTEIQSRFFFKDLYSMTSAITARHAFYGRESLLADIGHSLRHGHAHIGLFGLRRMGKTSVLLRLLETLSGSGGVHVAHVDVQRLDSVRQDAGFFLWVVGQQLVDTNRRLRHIEGLRMFGKAQLFSEIKADQDGIFELFDHDIRRIFSALSHDEIIVLFIDEIEHMLPSAPGSQWGNAFVRIWRFLKSFSQTHPGKLSFFMSGTNPSCVEKKYIGNLENPAHNFFQKVYLEPLSPAEGEKLITDIGRRIGLNWEADAVAEAVDLVGGHPLLLRAYGSRIHKSFLPRSQVVSVSLRDVIGCLDDVMLDVNSTLTQAIEVLEEQYPDEYFLLSLLARGQVAEFREYASGLSETISHLRGYGLVEDPRKATGIKNRLLHDWMQRRNVGRSKLVGQVRRGSLSPGDRVEGYEVICQIGHSGGTADVYEARPLNPEGMDRVALKIIRDGSLYALNREVEALQAVANPGIVKLLDHGKTISGDTYLVMELLAGSSLREYCSPTRALKSDDADLIMRSILKTLIFIHPNADIVERFSMRGELTVDELQQLQDARFGMIHRDIKPENVIIVDKRGPVLIDLGIGSRAGDPVRTVSATAGYLPGDGPGPYWSVDVDLYSLAVTVAQAVTGVSLLQGANTQDLLSAVKEHARGYLRGVLTKELSGSKETRFSSASSMLKALASGGT
jgi:AAA+ ATPase superfamily predicted ATPase